MSSATRLNPAVYPLTLYFDSRCRLCAAEMGNLMVRNTDGLLRFADVWAPDFEGPPAGTTQEELLTLIHARQADGGLLRGVAVFRAAYEAVGLGWVTAATRWPVIGPLADKVYPVLARNRYRLPQWLVQGLFERASGAAARRAAARHCKPDDDQCRL
ncbi:thiol-disulfide oxidoreductase DCC family protein [Paracidovorax valerianellae]|uniref:Predicted thiol-disulfide oxidoreductase YuxK, DCC family n=1 Tax=Paracidovorax valerianellae TaxID=187868 RepID=A0A1G6MCX0_9BURK|nr:DUF393 domain-containing protein [Paracidovorax valerianellae]MDA8444051.1 DUF393 domain-containing protein [Paracidovorax valerianellae]SDC53281.1 Predicted thiol-disulfide oxidoreductase YuxK, DCC family [Paracidovorax valerianellae]